MSKKTSKVVNGKLYSVDKATEIAVYEPIGDRGDFNYIRETLYKTQNGAYFLQARGGPKTKYRTTSDDGNGWTFGYEIRVLDDEEALEWCESRSIDGEIVAEEFPELVEPA